ncbi:putative pentatricopeptide repeat-containing protein At5g08310, mitochondrial [Salvia miltiorrhiza]|uniref:putative pentatricopeptide repeat-containing protein At5g08310, mitochondrial n=1 Tax=Salvia miltiorrhiza TaxID=226208 RepID=UPI0025ACCAC3|nr:putative pentatricopeptide repeat-containing protein At5g08310, mitochondrial [Salvia miltiorrhiza]XP_057806832.1 putative pentatricopeptide repeat-containing protein At5g08310, mitochondrial [Salvia miltiorrhiza]XP_057806833.1 putative pentatricopeptide repeat-containing protein At5g08310, mitochondrial [Salvia miltiorrhiza]XP_057806834.1 putative pentatricopeptide repeat-containing protein At5g08310, mitochondrial [Salvia miltiorrhiza]XP_057806835.1 putative pentatricopeptide repeat-contai
MTRIPKPTNRTLRLFEWTNQCLYSITSTISSNTNCTTHPLQNKFFCSSNSNSSSEKTARVEESLISIFTKRPFCSESPELQELSSKLTPQLVETVLKSFRNWGLAQLFFQWASNQRGYSHSCYVYNAMAEILSTARQNARLKELAVTLTNSSCYWTPGAFGYFLRCLGSQGLVEEANSLFDHMKMSALCVLNGYSYNCLLEVIAKSGDIGLLEYRLNEMRELDWPIDKHALTPALQCYCNAGQFDKAILVFNELTNKGWADQHIVSILVLSYSKRREVDMAFELIEWAERNLKISLNEKTLCILVHGFVREDRVDKALHLYDKMIKHGYLPDVSIYYVLIRGLCKNKAIAKALVLYEHMRESGIPPDVKIISQLLSCILDERDMIQLLEDALTDLDVGRRLWLFNSILKDLVNGGYADKAYCLLKTCTGSGINENSQEGMISSTKVKTDTTCFETVIDGLCNADKLDMALDLFHFMDQCGCNRSVLLFNNLIQRLSNADKLNECFNLLNEMKETEFHPTHFTYNCILGSLCRQLDVAGALDLLREMRACGHEPWIKNYTLLVKKLCEHEKADEAYSFLTDMSKEGFLPDMIAYSATIDGFLKANELDRGMKLFREICEQGYCPDVVAYNIIIKGLCMAKRISEAEDILKEILGKGLVPSVVTYNLLIDGWCKEGNTDQAVLCFSRMIEQEVESNIITYTTLVDGLCNSGKPEDALNLWIEMEHKGCCPNRISYMALIHGLCKCRRPDCAMVYLQEMEKKDIFPDPYVYQALVEAFASESNIDMAHKVLDKMSKHSTAA